MTGFRWLHFSDLHWGKSEHDIFWPGIELALVNDFDRLCELTGQEGWDAVFFTGDIVNTGDSEQFKKAGVKIKRLVEKLPRYGRTPKVFFVPGNHDLKRIIKSTNIEEKQLQSNIRQLVSSWFGNDKSLFSDFFDAPDQCIFKKSVVDRVFSNYTSFVEQCQNKDVDFNPGILPGDFSATLGNDDLKIGLIGLNSSFLHLEGGDFEGRLDLDL